MRGLVESFDDRRGDGLVRTDDGERLYFHCVNIADGSRSVAPGTSVSFRRGVGRLGHDEALEIVKEPRGDEGPARGVNGPGTAARD